MSNSAINVRVVFRDSMGNPRANGLVYFFENKTTTLASIFSDELLSIAQRNPYTLTASGEIAGDVKYSGTLTVTATNADGSDPLSDDNVTSQSGSGSGSGSDSSQFQTIESDPAAMTVTVVAGRVMTGETLVSIGNQTTTTIVSPVTNPRIDRIVIDKLTGVYSIVTGVEAASPTAPAITVGKMPSAQILLQTSTSRITEALITDERISGSVEPSNINTTETLSNKTIGDTNIINAQDDAFTIDDAADATLQIDFNAAGTTGTKTTITSSQTANRVITIPDAADTLVGKATTDTLTNKSIDLANNTATGTTTEFNAALSDDSFATLTNAVTLTNKTIGDTNTINAQDDAFTIDDAADATLQIDFNVTGTTGTKTTITSSQTANRTVTIPDATDTLVGKATTDTLTNKTLNLASNSVAGTTAQFNAALSDNDFATLAGPESLTNKSIDVTGTFELSGVTVTSTAAELNILDGVTSTAAELNYLDGATAGVVLTTGDEGTGNGLDADTVDGLEASQFLRSDVDDTTIGNITIFKGSPILTIKVANEATASTIIRLDDENGNGRGFLYRPAGMDRMAVQARDITNTVKAGLELTEDGKIDVATGTLQLAGVDITASATELSLLSGETDLHPTATTSAQGEIEVADATESAALSSTSLALPPGYFMDAFNAALDGPLGTGLSAFSSFDLNALIDNQRLIIGFNANRPAGLDSNGTLDVIAGTTSSSASQFVIGIADTGRDKAWLRSFYSGVWTSWFEVITTKYATTTEVGLLSGETDLHPTATTSAQGEVELATVAETITGTATIRAVTPASLQAKVASETVKGIVELATDAETITGTDTVRATHSAGVKAAIAAAHVILDTPEKLVNAVTTTGSWVTVNSSTLATAAATTAILAVWASAASGSATSCQSSSYFRKTGTGLATTAVPVVTHDIDKASSATALEAAGSASCTVNLDASYDFDWYHLTVGSSSDIMTIYLVGYYV